MHVTINGERRELPAPLSVAELLRHLAVKPEYVAVELNKDLVTRSRQAETGIASGDVLEIVTLVGGGSPASAPAGPELLSTLDVEPLKIGTHLVRSRLFVGTGKYATLELMRDCLEASGAEVVTVAVRRERLVDRQGATSSTSWIPGDTRSCPTRPAASRPRTPCAPPGWVASCSRAWTTPAPIG